MIPIYCKILEVYRGTWVADTTTTETPTGSFELGELTWSGTIAPTGAVQDGARFYARIIGGKGRLAAQVIEKNYVGSVPHARIARDIIAACGETIGTVDLTTSAAYYERGRGTAGQALNELCDQSGATWWVGRDGAVNVSHARPVTGAIDSDKAFQIGADIDGTTVLNVVHASDVSPGMVANGKPIRAIYWTLSPDALTAECAPSQPSVPDSRAREFYLKQYQAKVSKQNGDKSVDVIADGKFSLSSVPLLPGIVGSPTMKGGDLVVVGWLGGSPSSPYAIPAQQAGDNAKPVALLGDSVLFPLPPMVVNGTILVGGVPQPFSGVLTALLPQALGSVQGPGSQRLKLE